MQEDASGSEGALQAEALAHGCISLQQDLAEYGSQRRRLRVHKMRGIPFRDGYHDFAIRTGGPEVFPRLVASEHLEPMPESVISSDVASLDALVGGGLRRGFSTLLMGPAGVGKSLIAAQFAAAAASRWRCLSSTRPCGPSSTAAPGSASTMAERMHHLMERQLHNVTRLVDDLLDVSRLTRGVVTLKLRPVDVRDVVHQACDAAAAVAREKGVALERALEDQPLVVMADPVRLDQMVGNLLANAIRFTPGGGRIEVRAEREDARVRVRVRDTGQGIARNHLDRVFELFAQSDRPMDRGQGGLGIGLTIVRSLSELHGGSATIASEGEGLGTDATIFLPLHAETLDAGAPPVPLRLEVARKRVVIIEDNADAAEALLVYLQRLGHDVAVARDGRAGLDAVRRHRPHVVICDIGLPELDGYEVARRLLAQEQPQQCLLIAVTGYGDVVDRARTRAAGFSHHLTKPADPEALARLVEGSDAACA